MKKKYFIFRTILFAMFLITLSISCKREPEVIGSKATLASFTYVVSNNNLIPCNVAFTNTSNSATSYSWNFGNGQTSTEENPGVVNYTETGDYIVTLTATDANNPDPLTNQSVATTTIVIVALPTAASFNTAVSHNYFAPCTVTITNTSIDAANYSWDFGDGTTSILKDPPAVIYSIPGTYTISLTANNPLNHDTLTNKSETTVQIVVKDPIQWVCFFADHASDKIKYAVVDGNAPIVYDFIMNPLSSIYGMDIDTINNKVYFSDHSTKAIYVANCDGTGFQHLLDTDPFAIDGPYAVKVIGSKVYWSMALGIYSADLDGSNPAKSIDLSGIGFPEMPLDMDYDPVGDKIYLVNDKTTYSGGVWSIDLNGTNPTEIVTSVAGTSCEIDVANKKIYYTLFTDPINTDGLYWADLNGINISNIGKIGTSATYGIADYSVGGNLFWGFRASDNGADGKIIKSALNGSSPIDWITGINPYAISILKVKL